VAQRDKSESNLILTWPMLALGLEPVINFSAVLSAS